MLLLSLIALAGAYLLVCAFVFVRQRSLLYFPPRTQQALERFGVIRVESPGASAVDVFYLAAPQGSAGSPGSAKATTVVHFHGNAEQILDCAELGRAFRSRGLGFLAVEYPGYGRMSGVPAEAGLYAAAEAGLAYLRQRGVGPTETALMGQSLGSGVAVEMARRGHGARLVLISPYTSISEIAGHYYPWLPTALLVLDQFNSAGKAAEVRVPALLIHGENDETIPTELGRRLGSLLPNARVKILAGTGHNDVWERGGAALLDEVARFVRDGL
jgi:pimeloyl-ACP methyl ester carboxylesterase